MRSPYAVHRPVENAYLVRQRDRRRVRELFGVLLAVVMVGGGLLAYTWIHVEILRTGYRVDELGKELHRLQEEERYQRLEESALTHPETIASRARQELGMEAPRIEQTVFYEELAR